MHSGLMLINGFDNPLPVEPFGIGDVQPARMLPQLLKCPALQVRVLASSLAGVLLRTVCPRRKFPVLVRRPLFDELFIGFDQVIGFTCHTNLRQRCRENSAALKSLGFWGAKT